jgi:hypothetical protein
MSTILDPTRLSSLLARFEALRLDAPRRWGTMTPNEMLCHLADATDWVQGRRPQPELVLPTRVHWTKWIALYTPLPWPRGYPTRAAFDPRREGTKPAEFERDRRRAIESTGTLAETPADRLVSAHMIFGPMSRGDWGRWAYRHADYHLRQFGG